MPGLLSLNRFVSSNKLVKSRQDLFDFSDLLIKHLLLLDQDILLSAADFLKLFILVITIAIAFHQLDHPADLGKGQTDFLGLQDDPHPRDVPRTVKTASAFAHGIEKTFFLIKTECPECHIKPLRHFGNRKGAIFQNHFLPRTCNIRDHDHFGCYIVHTFKPDLVFLFQVWLGLAALPTFRSHLRSIGSH